MRNCFERLCGRIDDPDGRRVTPAVLTPAARAGVGHQIRSVGQAFPVRRPAAFHRYGFHELALVSALERHLVELTASAVGDLPIGEEQHALAVRTPSGHDVGSRVPCQAARLAACDRHDVYVDVVVVVRGEGDPVAVGRKVRRVFRRRMRGDLHGVLSVAVADPDISSVDEREVILRDRRLSQQAGWRILRRGQSEALA